MKKIYSIIALLIAVNASAGVFSGTVSTATPGGAGAFALTNDIIRGGYQTNGIQTATVITNIYSLTTNRANVYQIMISSDKTGVVNFYDSDNTNAPFYGIYSTNAQYYQRFAYSTNVFTSFIGQNNVTNNYTNSYQWVYNVTNVNASNMLSPLLSVAFTANVPAVLNVSALFERGITAQATTNFNYVILYNNGQ